jgi:hypothetical protein
MSSRHLLYLILLGPWTTRLTLSFFLRSPESTKRNALLSDLNDLIQQSDNAPSAADKEGQIKALMMDISKFRQGDQRLALPAQWELLYTTEKEINFFKYNWPFAKVSTIRQDIDPYQRCTVNNVISFEGGGEFAVTGSVVVAEDESTEYDRVNFEFTKAVVRGWGRELSIPPVGAGWFETLYCDDEYRLSRDSRGDWSVFQKL